MTDENATATATEEKVDEEEKEGTAPATVGDAVREARADTDTPAGEDTTNAKSEEETEEGEEKPPTLTAEQIKAASTDPAVRAAVLGGDEATDTIDALVRTALGQKEVEDEEQRVRVEGTKTVAEALKKGQESDDYSELGRLAADNLARNEAQAALLPGVQAAVYEEYDAAVTQVYEEEFKALSEEDRKALNRSDFGSDSDFLVAVFTTLKGKQEGLIRASMGVEVKDANEAATNATAAAKARADGDSMLGGGSPKEGGQGDASIGELVRAAHAASEAEE